MLGWKPKVSFEEGVEYMLRDIGHWYDASLWDEKSIEEATQDWFPYLTP